MVRWWWSDGEVMVSEVISCFNSLFTRRYYLSDLLYTRENKYKYQSKVKFDKLKWKARYVGLVLATSLNYPHKILMHNTD